MIVPNVGSDSLSRAIAPFCHVDLLTADAVPLVALRRGDTGPRLPYDRPPLLCAGRTCRSPLWSPTPLGITRTRAGLAQAISRPGLGPNGHPVGSFGPGAGTPVVQRFGAMTALVQIAEFELSGGP